MELQPKLVELGAEISIASEYDREYPDPRVRNLVESKLHIKHFLVAEDDTENQ